VEILEFAVLLRLIDERSTAFRAAVMSAPGLELQVPTCPEWTLLDLVQHLGEVHRFWAAALNAGPAAAPPAESAPQGAEAAPREREALLAWSAASTRQLLDTLREAGPDRGCWTWWGASQSPQTSGAVARHQDTPGQHPVACAVLRGWPGAGLGVEDGGVSAVGYCYVSSPA
jgi:uncharacterized protein (TIGR03083 family)